MTFLCIYLLQTLQPLHLLIILPQEFHISSINWYFILYLKIPFPMLRFVLCVPALEHSTLLLFVYIFQFWVKCLHCILIQFNLQIMPLSWHCTHSNFHGYSSIIPWLSHWILSNLQLKRLKLSIRLKGKVIHVWLAPHSKDMAEVRLHTLLTSVLEMSGEVNAPQGSVCLTSWTRGQTGPRDSFHTQ